jgi:SET domain-containing protein
MGLIVRSSDIHAAGVYTTARITAGTHIVEYTGPRISREKADELYEDRPYTYLFGLDDGVNIIDGHGTAAFINHCCDPNCETDEINAKVWIIALRDIEPGEELTYDYCLYDGDDDPCTCHCGTKNCRGTMYSEDEIKRLKKAAEDEKKVTAQKKKKGTKNKKAA